VRQVLADSVKIQTLFVLLLFWVVPLAFAIATTVIADSENRRPLPIETTFAARVKALKFTMRALEDAATTLDVNSHSLLSAGSHYANLDRSDFSPACTSADPRSEQYTAYTEKREV
jgi:hypothetical protein